MKTMPAEKKKITLSENQAKVIKDKYLREDRCAEDLFERVSHNIALSELIFHAKAGESTTAYACACTRTAPAGKAAGRSCSMKE